MIYLGSTTNGKIFYNNGWECMRCHRLRMNRQQDCCCSYENPKLLTPKDNEMTIKTFPITIKKQSWKQAVEQVGDTSENYNIWKVGNQYSPPKPGKYELVLVNGLTSFDEALKYAKDNNLTLTSPYHIFALDIDFEKELNQKYGWVVATKECAFEGGQQACCVWWGGTRRRAALRWVSDYGRPCDWFAFSRESADSEKFDTLPLKLVINGVEYFRKEK